MNVALSRAKSQLVLVGSLDFLREAVRGVNPDDEPHDLSLPYTDRRNHRHVARRDARAEQASTRHDHCARHAQGGPMTVLIAIPVYHISYRVSGWYEQENGRTNDPLLSILGKLEDCNRDFFIIFAHVEAASVLWNELHGGRMQNSRKIHSFKNTYSAFISEGQDARQARREMPGEDETIVGKPLSFRSGGK
jgi:hypothetical protein